MRTAALIEMLARGPIGARADASGRWLGAAALLGSGVAAAAMLILLGLRPDLGSAARQSMFWLKLAFPTFLALAAFVAAVRLGRPGGRAGTAWLAAGAAMALVWTAAVVQVLAAAPGTRAALVTGSSALPCVASIAALALPIGFAALFALRSLAPTRPGVAGGAAGLFAGASAAAIYALHCSEETLPFVAVWYVLGMLVPTLTGVIAGRRLLRWA